MCAAHNKAGFPALMNAQWHKSKQKVMDFSFLTNLFICLRDIWNIQDESRFVKLLHRFGAF